MNASIADMVHGAGPFPGAREAIVAMQDEIDTIVVSATPLHALEYEWHAHGLAQYMKVIAGQEMGSKPGSTVDLGVGVGRWWSVGALLPRWVTGRSESPVCRLLRGPGRRGGGW